MALKADIWIFWQHCLAFVFHATGEGNQTTNCRFHIKPIVQYAVPTCSSLILKSLSGAMEVSPSSGGKEPNFLSFIHILEASLSVGWISPISLLTVAISCQRYTDRDHSVLCILTSR